MRFPSRPAIANNTGDGQPTATPIHLTPPYQLRDTAGRTSALVELTDLVTGLDRPAQVWHGPVPCLVNPPGRGAAARLVRELAADARPRATVLTKGPSTNAADQSIVDEQRTHLVLADGRLVRVLALTTWPAAVTPDWLARATAASTEVAVHLRPVPTVAATRLLRRRLAAMTSTAYLDEQAGRLSDPAADLASRAADELRHAVAAGSTRLVHAQALFALTGDTDSELDDAEAALRRALAVPLAAAAVLHFEQAPAWAAVTRGGPALRWPWRLLDAASAAATLPHPVGPSRPSSRGALVGREPVSGVPVLVDRFALHNPNRLVVGTSGAGKSYATKLELIRQVVAGASAVVIDPEGEFGRVSDVLRGLTLMVGEEPAGLDPVGLACRPALPAAEGLSVLTSWANALLGSALSPVDLALLDRALAVLRADRGTTSPTAVDLLSVITDVGAHPPFGGATLPARLAPAASGTVADLFAPNPDLADPPALVVFDLRAVPGRVRPAVMACVLGWTWCQTIAAPAPGRRLVVVDEAHLLLEDPPAAELLAQFARRARKYGVALDVVTQRLSDFLADRAGEAVLANTATKLLLGCEDRERAAIAAGLALTPPETDLLRPGIPGRGLLLSPHLRSPVEIVADHSEHVIATAGPR